MTLTIEMTKEIKFSQIKHVAIYLRISDEKKVKGKRISKEETLQIHKDRLIDFCDRNGFTYDIYSEIISGKKDLTERKELNEVLKNLTKYDAIIVNEVSRLARNTEIAGAIKNTLERFDKMLLTPEHTYWMRDANDAMIFNVGAAIVEHERRMIAKRIKNDKVTLSRQGLNASGSVPLGYVRNADSKSLDIDPETAHIPKEAFDLILKGLGAHKIAQIFNEKGYKTRKGNSFTIRAIKDLLKCETYKGTLIYNNVEKFSATDDKGNEITIQRKKEAVRIDGAYPKIVEPDQWNSVQEIRSIRGERYKGGREKPSITQEPSKLKDLLYCDHCKRKMRIVFEAKKQKFMVRNCVDILPDGSKCPNSGFLVENLEPKIFEALFAQEKKLDAEIKALKANKTEQIEEQVALEKKRIDKLIADLEEEAMRIAEAEFSALLDTTNQDMMKKVIQKKKDENALKRSEAQKQLEKINLKLERPKIEDEIKKRLNVILAIQKVKKEKSSEKINNIMKQFIFKIHYDRKMPEEIRNLGIKHPKRKNFEAKIKIEFI